MTVELPFWFHATSVTVLSIILLVDLFIIARRPHQPSTRETSLWVAFYVTLALIFAGLIFVVGNANDPAGVSGAEHSIQFLAGWLTEYSLSVDNLFVFLLIMAKFQVPKQYQQEMLMLGIIVALILRAAFIIVGASLVENFTWLFYIFGGFLFWVALQQIRSVGGHDDDEGHDHPLIRRLQQSLKVSPEWDGTKWRTRVNGHTMFTPVFLVFLSLGVTDLLFAIDSIPAIFGITTSPFLVFTANVFALMGLRQLYFLLGAMVDKLYYLAHGVAVILAFIGVKLVFHALHTNEVPFINNGQHVDWVPEIETSWSLIVIAVSLVTAVALSLLRIRRTATTSE
ncbi:MAG: hypothetical protein RL431_168 [Actinomycetota bacterium]